MAFIWETPEEINQKLAQRLKQIRNAKAVLQDYNRQALLSNQVLFHTKLPLKSFLSKRFFGRWHHQHVRPSIHHTHILRDGF